MTASGWCRLRGANDENGEDPRLGHLQFEALLTTARHPEDFALIAPLALPGLRVFEACGASIGDLGEEHGHQGSSKGQGSDMTVVAGSARTPRIMTA